MKRFTLITIFLMTLLGCWAQFTGTGVHKSYFKKYTGIDYVFVFNGINPQSAILFNGPDANNVKWYSFDNQTTPLVLQTPNENYAIEDATGYIMKDANGAETTFWVVDYTKYNASFTSLIPEFKPKEQCADLSIDLVANVLPIAYKTKEGIVKSMERVFNLSYNTRDWNGTTWVDKVETQDVILPRAKILVQNPPLKDTRFSLSKLDNFAVDLAYAADILESDMYSAVKTEAHIVSSASVREELNEAERPESATVTTGSAPLDIVFKSNANTPVTEFFQWQILKDKSLLLTRNDEDLRYTFTEAGNYNVRLVASNTNCVYSDSVAIKIVESKIEVPRVFTPNGDGMNDEFRVAYQSIVKFRCWVFNRWQKQLYYWADPQKGWDGNINGKPARPGAYFYVIEAEGSDGEKYNLKGNINLLR